MFPNAKKNFLKIFNFVDSSVILTTFKLIDGATESTHGLPDNECFHDLADFAEIVHKSISLH